MIGHLEKMFCDFGIPETLLSENWSQYDSSEFIDFAKRMHIQHTTSSPRYPQSNGMAEKMIQNIKRSLTNMLADGKSPDTTQSSGSVEQPPNNSPSRTVRPEEPTLRRSERTSVCPKYLQDFVSS